MGDNNFDIYIRLISERTGEDPATVLKKIKAGAADAGEEVKKHTGHVHGLHRAYSFLGRAINQEFGHLTHFIFNPITAALGLVALATHHVSEHFAELAKKIEEAKEKMRELELTQLNAVRDAAVGAGEGMEKFNIELAKASGSKDPLHGEKFSSPQQELARRLAIAGGLEANATGATNQAEAYRNNPGQKLVATRLAQAMKDQPILLKEMEEAAETLKKYQESVARGDVEAPFGYVVEAAKQAASKARSKFNSNEQRITSDRGWQNSFGIGQARLDAAAGEASGLATGNRSAITSLGETIGESERVRRGGLFEQLTGQGFGTVQANRLIGAGAAAGKMANNERVTGMDAADYNAMLGQVKAGMAKAFLKSIQDVLADGIVTPEEAKQIRAQLNNLSQRQ